MLLAGGIRCLEPFAPRFIQTLLSQAKAETKPVDPRRAFYETGQVIGHALFKEGLNPLSVYRFLLSCYQADSEEDKEQRIRQAQQWTERPASSYP